MVVLPRTAELLALMPERTVSDQSSYLLSPMRGLLTRLLVADDDNLAVDQPILQFECAP